MSGVRLKSKTKKIENILVLIFIFGYGICYSCLLDPETKLHWRIQEGEGVR